MDKMSAVSGLCELAGDAPDGRTTGVHGELWIAGPCAGVIGRFAEDWDWVAAALENTPQQSVERL